jgi:hypothetical protein
VATGPEALAFVETLDGKYRAGRPVPFIADIVAEAEIEQVAIDNLEWQELAGKPERFAYVLTLLEYIEPLEPEDTSFVDTDVLDDVMDIMEALTAGFEIAEQLSQFIDQLTELNKALEHKGLGAVLPSP